MSEQHQNIVDETKCFYKGTNRTFGRKCEFDALEAKREQELQITREVQSSMPYQGIQSFGQYVPSATMEDNDDSITIKVTNYNCLDIDVKLFYSTTSGDNGLDNYNNDWVRNRVILTSDNWGGNFLDSNGKVWVADGSTLPAAFNSVVELNVLYSFGAGTLVSLSTQVGEGIDAFLLRFTEAVLSAIGGTPDYNLADMSVLGSQMYYVGDTLYINFIQYNKKLGGSAPQAVQITGETALISVSNDGNVFSYNLKYPNPTPYNIPVEVIDLSDISDGDSYAEFVRSITQQDLYVEDLRRYSNNADQVNQTFEFIKFDLDGNEDKLTQTDVVDPYQVQAVINEYADIVLDGQTYAITKMLAGEYMEIQMSYDKVGILSLEEVEQLQTILDEQGVKISEGEQRELEESYLSFSGFSDETKKIQNIVIIGLILLLVFKK